MFFVKNFPFPHVNHKFGHEPRHIASGTIARSMTRWQKVHFEGASLSSSSSSSSPLPLPCLRLSPHPLPTSMINHERKRFNFFGAREMQTSSIPVVEEGRKLFLERQLKALARVWTRSNLGKAWNELRKLARKKREREREREIEMKEKRAFLSPPSPLSLSDYPISCSTIRAAGRKLLNYCRLTDRFFRVALISRRKGGSRRRGGRGSFCRLSGARL